MAPCVRIDVASLSNFCVNLRGKRERDDDQEILRTGVRMSVLEKARQDILQQRIEDLRVTKEAGDVDEQVVGQRFQFDCIFFRYSSYSGTVSSLTIIIRRAILRRMMLVL